MMQPLGHYHAHENPGGVEIVEMRLGEPPIYAPQGALDRGWVASPDLRVAYGVPVDATAVTIQLKAKAVCPTWSEYNCVAMIGAALRKYGSTEQTAHSVYAEAQKPAIRGMDSLPASFAALVDMADALRSSTADPALLARFTAAHNTLKATAYLLLAPGATTPRTISYNTVTVAIGSVNGKFEAHVEQNIVNHAELELNFSVVGYWHAGT